MNLFHYFADLDRKLVLYVNLVMEQTMKIQRNALLLVHKK